MWDSFIRSTSALYECHYVRCVLWRAPRAKCINNCVQSVLYGALRNAPCAVIWSSPKGRLELGAYELQHFVVLGGSAPVILHTQLGRHARRSIILTTTGTFAVVFVAGCVCFIFDGVDWRC